MAVNLSIVVPFLNEEEALPAFFAELRRKLPLFEGSSLELIFVNDGSTDRSEALIREEQHIGYHARLVRLSRNFGAHEAFRAGLFVSKGDFVTSCSADLQITFETLHELYEKCCAGYDVAYAVKSRNQSGGLARAISRIYAGIIRKTVTKLYPENGADCFMMRRKVVNELNENIEPNSSIMLQIFSLGFKTVCIESEVQKRVAGKSKWSFSRKVKLMLDTLFSFSYVPLRFLEGVGFALALAAIIYAIVIAISKWLLNSPIPMGYSSLICVVLFGFGITNISLGITAEYLLRDLDASRKRKVFIIDEEYDLNGVGGQNDQPV